MPVNQAVFDELLSNALLVFRYAASERASTVERLRALERELIGKLAEEAVTDRQQRRVETFLNEMEGLIDRRFTQLVKQFEYADFARTVATDLQYGLIHLGFDGLILPKDHYFQSLESDIILFGNPAEDWWRGQSQDLAFKFKAQVRQGLNNAETNQQIINRIVGKAGEPGIMDTARNNAATLVQTSVQAVANDARRNTFKANSDVINGIKQVSTLDSHTSLTCIAYSEAEWDLDYKPTGHNKLAYNGGTPRHMNCRSIEIPLTKSFKELGLKTKDPEFTTRASDEGPINAKTTFNNFLVRKGAAYQDEMLGKGRADMWRAGKITLKDLVDGKGRPLTLAELQAAIDAKRR